MNLESEFIRHKLRVDGAVGNTGNIKLGKYIKTNGKILIPIASVIFLLMMKPRCIYDSVRNRRGVKTKTLSTMKLLLWAAVISSIVWFLLKEKLS